MFLLFLEMLDDENEKAFFEKAYYHYRDFMHYTAFHYLRDSQLAEDAVQDALLRVVRNIQQIINNESVECIQTKAYIVNIVRSVCIDMIRKSKLSSPEIISQELAERSQDSYLMEDEVIDSLCGHQPSYQRILSLLTEEEQIVLSLRFTEGLTTKEISVTLQQPEDNVRKRITRAKQKLKRLLDAEQKGTEPPPQ